MIYFEFEIIIFKENFDFDIVIIFFKDYIKNFNFQYLKIMGYFLNDRGEIFFFEFLERLFVGKEV